MLPSDAPAGCIGCGAYGSWPASGEIDIMDAVNDMNTTYASTQFGGPAASPGQASHSTHGLGQTPLSEVTSLCCPLMSHTVVSLTIQI